MKILIHVIDVCVLVLLLAALASGIVWMARNPQPGTILNLSELSEKVADLENRTQTLERSAVEQGEAIRKRLEQTR